MSELQYTNLTHDLAEQCAALEHKAFPNTEPEGLFTVEGVHAYADIFPEGFFVCLDQGRVVGQAAGILLDFDFDDRQHTIAEITGEHQCANHRAEGDWYYGTDIVVDPEYRRRGIGQALYELRKDVVRRLGKKGIVAGGYMPGFADHKDKMSAAAYIEGVVGGEIYDATLTFQIKNGFEVRGVLEGYVEDEHTDGWHALIVWDNPDYEKSA
jgi:GNAT superfamily N-acetyltransferase